MPAQIPVAAIGRVVVLITAGLCLLRRAGAVTVCPTLPVAGLCSTRVSIVRLFASAAVLQRRVFAKVAALVLCLFVVTAVGALIAGPFVFSCFCGLFGAVGFLSGALFLTSIVLFFRRVVLAILLLCGVQTPGLFVLVQSLPVLIVPSVLDSSTRQ